MSENKNIKLNDEAMAHASGGVTFDPKGTPKFNGFGTVIKYLGDQHYLVRRDDGVEITASFDQRHIVEEGTEVGLIMLCGGWAMEESRDY